jgi:hypothetical protein
MSPLLKSLYVLGILIPAALPIHAQKSEPAPSGPTTLVITFKDGHQQTYLMSEVARVEYVGSSDAVLGPEYFIGRWEVGSGSANGTFLITLESNGDASKTLGASHGIWTVEENEARIDWDDGWHDAIRRVGTGVNTKHEKFAFEPGTTFTDKPNNVTAARKVDQKSTENGGGLQFNLR